MYWYMSMVAVINSNYACVNVLSLSLVLGADIRSFLLYGTSGVGGNVVKRCWKSEANMVVAPGRLKRSLKDLFHFMESERFTKIQTKSGTVGRYSCCAQIKRRSCSSLIRIRECLEPHVRHRQSPIAVCLSAFWSPPAAPSGVETNRTGPIRTAASLLLVSLCVPAVVCPTALWVVLRIKLSLTSCIVAGFVRSLLWLHFLLL